MGRRLHRSRRSAQRSNFNPRKKQAFAKNPLLNQLMKSELRRSDKRGHGHRLPGAADRRRVTLHEAGTRSQPLPGMGADRRRGHSLTETTMGKHGLAQVNAAIVLVASAGEHDEQHEKESRKCEKSYGRGPILLLESLRTPLPNST